jgi:hypothetical protein
MGDFVRPEPIRLSISGGHYIDIKKRLNHGEREDMYARIAPYVVPGELPQMNRREVRTAKVLTYLLGWSLVDDEGTPVAFSPVLSETDRLDTIRSLDPDRFDEIHIAIEKHEEAYEKELAKKKKSQATASASPATSPSPVAVAGPITTSVN